MHEILPEKIASSLGATCCSDESPTLAWFFAGLSDVARYRRVARPSQIAPRLIKTGSRMKTSKRTTIIAIAGISLAAFLTYANAAQSLKIDFSDETAGAEPKSFVSVVGVWRIENDGNCDQTA